MIKGLYILAFLLFSHALEGQTIIETIEFDGSDFINFAVDVNECDGNPGTFGINGQAFEIREVEGNSCCPCAVGGGTFNCGDNVSTALFDLIDIIQYCSVSIRAEVNLSSGVFECRDPSFAPITNLCNDQLDPGRDAMKIEIITPSNGIQLLGGFCGRTQIGTFQLDNIQDDVLFIQITGGTQDPDEAYFIERIIVEGNIQSPIPAQIVPANNNSMPCAVTEPLILNLIAEPGSTYQWALDGNLLPDVGDNITRTPAELIHSGTYSVTVTEPSGCTATTSIDIAVQTCITDPTFSFDPQYCWNTDTLFLPSESIEGINGTWNVDTIFPLGDHPYDPGPLLIFEPDPSTGAETQFIIIEVDTFPIMGNFPPGGVDVCVLEGPNQFVNLDSILELRQSTIFNVEGFGRTFPAPIDLQLLDVSNFPEGTYKVRFTSEFAGECGNVLDSVDIILTKLDIGESKSIAICESDPSPINFADSINSVDPSGQWIDVNNSGINLSNPGQVDVSNLAPGVYEYDFVVGSLVQCPFVTDTATLTIEILSGTSIHRRTFEPSNLCIGDGSSFTFGNDTYDENNTSGQSIIVGAASNGCDSLIIVNLTYNAPTSGEELYDGCQNDGHSIIVGGTTYDESNPTGTETLSNAHGCDSTVTINLTFNAPVSGSETHDGCSGDGYSVTVGSSIYNEASPNGTDLLTSQTGCDSVVTTTLTFRSNSLGDETHLACENDGFSVTVGTSIYDENNPAGSDTLIAANGCDSIVTTDLTFLPAKTGLESYTGCQGDGYSVVVNGNTYDGTRPFGTEILRGANGCDSIVTIDLDFGRIESGSLNSTGCQGNGFEVTIGGILFNEANPSGTAITTGSNGCDSLVSVNLEFLATTFGTSSYEGCSGDNFSIQVGNTVYNETNPSGIDTIINQAGCDSIVTTSLVFRPNATGMEEHSGCINDGYAVIVGSSTYDENNPSGIDTLIAANGCDSIVTTMLSFMSDVRVTESYTGCQGDGYAVTVNGNIYDEFQPNGTETMSGSNGCDSIVTIDLIFQAPTTGSFTSTGCQGDGFEITIGGIQFNEANPTGTAITTGSNGCDSLLSVNLEFLSNSTGTLTYDGCENDGHFETVNGTRYDQSNPIGSEILTGAASNSCDSIVEINLNYNMHVTGNVFNVGPVGSGFSTIVNGTTYDENNPTGTEVLTGAASNGCDSIVTIELIFLDGVFTDNSSTHCSGDGYSEIVNGITYDENNPNGIDTLAGSMGRDSIVSTNLTFNQIGILNIDLTRTSGGGFDSTINGTNYNESFPTGTDVIAGGSSNGCDSIINVNINYITAFRTTIDTSICFEDDFEIQVGSNIYNENNPFGIDTFSTSIGIDSIVTTRILFRGRAIRILDTILCSGDLFSISVGSNIYNQSNPSGLDTLLGQGFNGCDSFVQVLLQYQDDILISINDAICPGDEIRVGNSIYNYNMLSGVDTVIGTTGCDTIFTTNLSLDSVAFSFDLLPSCPNYNNGSITLFNEGGAPIYDVLIGNDSYQLSNLPLEINSLGPGQYNLMVSNANGCSISEVFEIETINVSAPEIITSQIGIDSLQLSVLFNGNPDSTVWTSNTSTICTECQVIIVDPRLPDIYSLTIFDASGCIFTESVTVGETNGTSPAYYVGNSIAPNGDISNSIFFLQTADPRIIDYDLSIYNRWGDLLFKADRLPPNDSSVGWSPVFGGQSVAQGVYIYLLTIRNINGEEETDAGDILVVR